jgi:hypothetical protein
MRIQSTTADNDAGPSGPSGPSRSAQLVAYAGFGPAGSLDRRRSEQSAITTMLAGPRSRSKHTGVLAGVTVTLAIARVRAFRVDPGAPGRRSGLGPWIRGSGCRLPAIRQRPEAEHAGSDGRAWSPRAGATTPDGDHRQTPILQAVPPRPAPPRDGDQRGWLRGVARTRVAWARRQLPAGFDPSGFRRPPPSKAAASAPAVR